ncbi:hypothetical protein, partial, partial [Absidia glauca]
GISGNSGNSIPQSVPTTHALDSKFDSVIQGMTRMFEKMDTFLAHASSNSSGPSTTPSSGPSTTSSSGSFVKKCFNCKASDHQTQTCPLPCKYCKSSAHKHYECMDPKAIAARQFRKNPASSASPTPTDSMLIDVLAADKRPHPEDPSSSSQVSSKRMDTRSRSMINVDELPTTSKPHHSRVKLASQVSSDHPIDIAALVNLPVYNLSLAQIASHPTWR